jgi:hypothetical protein
LLPIVFLAGEPQITSLNKFNSTRYSQGRNHQISGKAPKIQLSDIDISDLIIA